MLQFQLWWQNINDACGKPFKESMLISLNPMLAGVVWTPPTRPPIEGLSCTHSRRMNEVLISATPFMQKTHLCTYLNTKYGIKSILHMYCCGTRKSHPRTRIIRQKRGSAEFLTTNYSGPRVGFPCPTTIHHDGYIFSTTLCLLRFYMNSVSSAYFFRFFAFVPF